MCCISPNEGKQKNPWQMCSFSNDSVSSMILACGIFDVQWLKSSDCQINNNTELLATSKSASFEKKNPLSGLKLFHGWAAVDELLCLQECYRFSLGVDTI